VLRSNSLNQQQHALVMNLDYFYLIILQKQNGLCDIERSSYRVIYKAQLHNRKQIKGDLVVRSAKSFFPSSEQTSFSVPCGTSSNLLLAES